MTLRRVVKLAALAVCSLLVAPLIVGAWFEKVLVRTEGVFGTFGQLLALVPGPIGVYLRAAYCWGTLDACSPEVHIGFGSVFTHRGARLARNVSTGFYCVIGHATIGEGARLASRVSVPSGKRQHLDDTGAMSDDNRFERVAIGSGCWVGEGAIVLADVGERCIVSAGAVVLKPVPPGCIVGGNPARVLKTPSGGDAPA
jgi:acetyltransferase-like isoleucine patch superfamily enzyme